MKVTPWFGLADEKCLYFLSIVSAYNRQLSELEFTTLPQEISEYDIVRQQELVHAFENFYDRYIRSSKQITHRNDQDELEPVTDLDTHLNNFIYEKYHAGDFISNSATFFLPEAYLEILVFSPEPWFLDETSPLFQRVINEEVYWEDTGMGKAHILPKDIKRT